MELTCRECSAPLDHGIVTIEDGALVPASALCNACIAEDAAEEERAHVNRPSVTFDYREFTILPGETWPQYVRRVFPNLAGAMFDQPTTPRDQEFFRHGVQCAFAEETYARQTFQKRRTSRQIVEDFIAGFDFDEEDSDGAA